MYISTDPKSSVPLNEQLKEQMRLAVAVGVLRPGDQLPTVRELAGRLRLNPNTVARAYRELQAEGLLTSTQGRGTFVSDDAKAVGEQEGRRLIADRLQKASGLALDLELDPKEFIKLAEQALREASDGRRRSERGD